MQNKILVALLFLSFCLARDPFILPEQDVPLVRPGKAAASGYRAVPLQYLPAEDAAKLIEKLYPDALVCAEKNNNILLLGADHPTEKILAVLQAADTPPRAVKLKINVIEMTTNDLSALGLAWDFTAEGFRLGKTTPEILATLQALSGRGETHLLAAPDLTTVVGKSASIHIGDRLPYSLPVQANDQLQWQIQYLDSGINLTFLPLPAAPGHILLSLQPAVSSIKYWKQTQGGEFPVLSTRQVETTVLLKAQESFVLAGLYNEEERDSVQKIPFLGDLPLLGFLFRSSVREKTASDIVFVVTAEES
ncbi:bacterial secretin superfamilty protein [Candidatus Termititenax persephonae]|uniref:Bacterial secretin superfamilty protein n=1 Tax=Candidatus Termititenax persephonae TaxID=2218525 RepID=A0A388TJF0_9BACT|nr:bacterial secretin superfamilty protein [Candidatus Termititenax persephonae]